jgi:teichuronic acid biosynthesis glycosyltransferase TuaC
MQQRPHILTLSALFPDPGRPVFGNFVARQTAQILSEFDTSVVVPTRIFPHLRLWREWRQPRRLAAAWADWRRATAQIPLRDDRRGFSVYYPRFSSPPRQLLHALDGFFAYPAVLPLIRRLQRERPFALMHAHYATPAGVIALLARRRFGVPVVLSIHGEDLHFTARQHRLGRQISAWALRSADLVLANSNWTAAQIRALAEPRRLAVVRLGGDLPQPAAATTAVPPAAGLTLLSVGNLHREKGHALMLQALRRLIDAGHTLRYRIVGDGPQRSVLEQLTQQLGLTAQVEFVGARPPDEMAIEYAACDIFALPSWIEAFGLVYIEALGMGKPVLGCRGAGGPDDLAALGDCIELVRPQDVDDLTAGLQRLIGDPQRRAALAAAGRAIVAEHYSWAGCGRTTRALYRELLAAAAEGGAA